MHGRLSVILPSRQEKYLQRTIDDVLAKARGDVEVLAVCDGYVPDPPLVVTDPRVRVLMLDAVGLRDAVNAAMEAATGEFVMKLDAHCAVAEGFDEVLKRSCDDDWVVVPRRYSLDAETWTPWDGRPPIDYEYLAFPYRDTVTKGTRIGNNWHERTRVRGEYAIDEDPTFQGSCYFLRQAYWQRLGPLRSDLWTSFILEPEELSNKVWMSGGSVHVNKTTWYAHFHKGKANGRGYFLNKKHLIRGREHHAQFFMGNQWLSEWPRQLHSYAWLIDKFDPMPGWPEGWRAHFDAQGRWTGPTTPVEGGWA